MAVCKFIPTDYDVYHVESGEDIGIIKYCIENEEFVFCTGVGCTAKELKEIIVKLDEINAGFEEGFNG